MTRFPQIVVLWVAAAMQLSAQVPPRVPNTTLQMPPELFSSVAYQMEDFDLGEVGEPVALTSPPGDMRLFVVDRAGIIRVIPDLDNPVPEVFLDIRDRVEAGFGEEGLLGLAFHPDYANNGLFYVFYTRQNADPDIVHDDTIARFSESAADPDRADAGSESILIQQPGDRWGRNHNGGDLHFGTDGYLYVSLGDGGNYGNAREIDGGFYAAVMRLDVDSGPGSLAPNAHPSSLGGYRIPPDNPFVGATSFNGSPVDPADVRTEFFAVGLRNPWRFSIDAVSGAILLGDVGEGNFEEINSIVSGGNYGWPYREGTGPGEQAPPAGASFVEPINAYGRSEGLSVIGGIIYRGSRLPELNGYYIFSDWGGNEVRALMPDGSNPVGYSVLSDTWGFGPSAFGKDPRNGDILVAHTVGWTPTPIRRLVRNSSGTSDDLPATLSATGAFSDLATLTPNAGVLPYEINVPFWSDGGIKSRWFSLPDTSDHLGFDSESPWSFPAGAVWIKHFEIEMVEGDPASRRRLETRFLVKTATSVYGVTYRWNAGGTEAFLVPEEGESEVLARTVGGSLVNQTWDYPSRSSCLSCHTPDGGHALGFDSAQLNLDRAYGVETHNQIVALETAGYFAAPPSPPRSLTALAPAGDTTISTEFRARSYLQANCAQCHDGTGIAAWDARLRTPLAEAGIIDGPLNNNGGDPDNRVIAPGDPAHSMLLTRISTRGSGQMPPIASHVIDSEGVALITAWINSLSGYQDYDAWSLAEAGQVLEKLEDSDGDGLNNCGEFLLGLGPLNPVQRWAGAQLFGFDAGGNAEIGYQRTANRAYRVEYSNSLDGDWQFLDVPGNEPRYLSTSGTTTLTDTMSPAERRFYRVLLLKP